MISRSRSLLLAAVLTVAPLGVALAASGGGNAAASVPAGTPTGDSANGDVAASGKVKLPPTADNNSHTQAGFNGTTPTPPAGKSSQGGGGK